MAMPESKAQSLATDLNERVWW